MSQDLRSPVRFSALAGGVLLILLLLPASAAARVSQDFVGLTSEDLFKESTAYRQTTLADQTAAGAGLIRQTFDWKLLEVSPGNYDFHRYDTYVADAARQGITVLPVLFNPPRFRSSRPRRGARRGVYPPRDPKAMGRLGAALVARYGPNGSLWAERPDLPRQAIRAWQVWNEPNLRYYWPRGPNARSYTRLLSATGKAIKKADPDAEIVTAGLPESRLRGSVSLRRFITGIYRAGGRRAFDTLAVNAYARTARELDRRLKGVRRLMNARHDRRARIWITEIGWCDRGVRSGFCVGARGQANRITSALSLIRKRRRSLRIRGLVYYSWRDGRPYAPRFQDFWGLHSGLLTTSGKRKRSFAAFTRGVRALRR